MKKVEVQSKIKDIIVFKLGVDINEIEDSSNLRNDLGADSLDEVEVIMEVEKEFNIDISNDESDELKTFQNIFDCVVSKIQIED